jgi:hypothetical protein
VGWLQFSLGILGVLYWIPGAYLAVTGHSVPSWLLWPFRNPRPKRFRQMFGAALLVQGIGVEANAFTIGSTSAAGLGVVVVAVSAAIAAVRVCEVVGCRR